MTTRYCPTSEPETAEDFWACIEAWLDLAKQNTAEVVTARPRVFCLAENEHEYTWYGLLANVFPGKYPMWVPRKVDGAVNTGIEVHRAKHFAIEGW